MRNKDKVDENVARMLRQMLADSDESALHELRRNDFSANVGAPSSVFFVSTLPKDHPLYTRNHGHEILEEDEISSIYAPAKPASHRHAI